MFARVEAWLGRAGRTLFFCTDGEDNEPVNRDAASREVFSNFNHEYLVQEEIFKQEGGEVPQPAISFWEHPFSRLCVRARDSRRPLLVLVIKDTTRDSFK